jgi:biopolymer transport protein ExbB
MTESAESPIVLGTLYLLVFFSVVTWSVIIIKGLELWRLAQQMRSYARAFWAAGDLASAERLPESPGAAARIAGAGFSVLSAAGGEAQDLAHSGPREQLLERSLRQQLSKERRGMEAGLALLASIGSTSPFVGLFGTVWGIMHALQSISRSGSASLDVVAGPIGEALVATAVGIAVAVPAVLAYNYFVRSTKLLVAELEDFATDFLNLAIRVGLSLTPPGK